MEYSVEYSVNEGSGFQTSDFGSFWIWASGASRFGIFCGIFYPDIRGTNFAVGQKLTESTSV